MFEKISSEIISAYRGKNYRILVQYGRRLDFDIEGDESSMNRLFLKLIKSYHPDRIESLKKNIDAALKEEDLSRLEQFASQMGVPGYVDLPERDAAAYSMEYEEVYAFDESSPAGWYEFSENEESGERFSGDADIFNEEYYAPEYEAGFGFREVINEEMLGNMVSEDLQVQPGDLVELEELILADRDMENLKGIDYCYNLSVLDISGNNLESIAPLAALTHLKILDLSRNMVTNINALAECSELVYLNLADNDIVNITALGELQNLLFLDLSHNPIVSLQVLLELPALESLVLYGIAEEDSETIELLEQKGVAVIY